MDNNFRKALDFVLSMEGGYSNHPNDLGGETNFGITTGVYNAYRKQKNLPLQSVKYISSEEIEEIYFKKYFLASGADKISDNKLALIHFDTAVNMGVSRANNFLTLSHGNIQEYLKLRKNKYIQFANVPSPNIFLKGWLNRLCKLEKYINSHY